MVSNALCNYVYASITHGQDKLNVLDTYFFLLWCFACLCVCNYCYYALKIPTHFK